MTYHLTIVEKPFYLHATATGTRNPENARRFLLNVYEACAQRDCWSVLLEMKMSGPSLNTVSIVDVIGERSAQGQKFRRIAYVDAGPGHDPHQARFAETVALNRGVNVRLFATVDDAERWMSEAAPGR